MISQQKKHRAFVGITLLALASYSTVTLRAQCVGDIHLAGDTVDSTNASYTALSSLLTGVTTGSTQAWLTLSNPNPTGAFSVTANATGVPRRGDIQLYDNNGCETWDIIINQYRTPTTFQDVPVGTKFFDTINLLYSNYITNGCSASPLDFCPTSTLSRDEAAVFIIRSIYPPSSRGVDTFTYGTTPYFSDVSSSSVYFPFIQKMYELGITTGCGGGNYCPSSALNNYQLAVFAVRASQIVQQGYINNSMTCGSSYAGNPNVYNCSAYFSDVSSSDTYFSWVQKFVEMKGVPAPLQPSFSYLGTGGTVSRQSTPSVPSCSAGNFCETNSVTRDWGAYASIRAIVGDTSN
jgi:hypothetical protein